MEKRVFVKGVEMEGIERDVPDETDVHAEIPMDRRTIQA